jgi:hypothetical protein
VPPPPAPGAPVRLGVGLAPAFGVGECDAPLDAVAPAEELAPPPAAPPEAAPPEAAPPEAAPLAALPLAAPLAVLPEAAPLAVLPEAVPLAADELLPVGGGTVPGLEDDEQPAKAAEARMAKTPKRTAVSFGLSAEPAITRTVM